MSCLPYLITSFLVHFGTLVKWNPRHQFNSQHPLSSKIVYHPRNFEEGVVTKELPVQQRLTYLNWIQKIVNSWESSRPAKEPKTEICPFVGSELLLVYSIGMHNNSHHCRDDGSNQYKTLTPCGPAHSSFTATGRPLCAESCIYDSALLGKGRAHAPLLLCTHSRSGSAGASQ